MEKEKKIKIITSEEKEEEIEEIEENEKNEEDEEKQSKKKTSETKVKKGTKLKAKLTTSKDTLKEFLDSNSDFYSEL